MDFQINHLTERHFNQVKEIYLEGISTGNATFETEAPEWEKWDGSHSKECRLVAEHGGVVFGWAALSPVSGRCVYAGVADVSIYVAGAHKGKGIGTALLRSIIELSEQHGFWTLQAGIFPENTSSLKLHEKAGFRRIGVREKIGKMNGFWRDVVFLERRSGKL